MNEDISRIVIGTCADLDLEPRSYSGRGMHGKACVGVDCDGSSHQTLAKLVIALMEQGPDGVMAAEHFTRSGAIASDSMGLGSIVYFPRLPWVSEEEDEEEEEGEGDAQPAG